ncbi:RodZ domain-containing protein [Pyruvatibacter sp.]|uniref:helix-turn-helix domain-containing protein n=1 Tax=Pyruvatibacter sp. TaxID=1981328 RepID=UPI003264B9F4
MGKVTKLNLEDASVRSTRRLHLRDIQDDNPEPRGTTGAQMHAARLALGEDISAVAGQLRIRRDQIEAIEGGDFDALPGRAYSIGFVRTYAEYLGLDEVETVTAFKAEFDAAQTSGPSLVFPEAEEESRIPRGAFVVIAVLAVAALYGVWTLTVSADRVVEERTTGVPSVVPETRVAPAVRPASLPRTAVERSSATAGAAETGLEGSEAAATDGGTTATDAADVSGTAASQTENAASETDVTAEAGTAAQTVADADGTPGGTSVDTSGVTGEAATETASAQQPASPPAAATPSEDQVSPLETGAERSWEGFVYGQQNHDSRIFIRANAQTWVRVEDGDGNVLLSRTLRAGESYRAPNRAGMVLATRNAGALQLFVDGKSAGTAGPVGQPLADIPLDPATLSGQ